MLIKVLHDYSDVGDIYIADVPDVALGAYIRLLVAGLKENTSLELKRLPATDNTDDDDIPF